MPSLLTIADEGDAKAMLKLRIQVAAQLTRDFGSEDAAHLLRNETLLQLGYFLPNDRLIFKLALWMIRS